MKSATELILIQQMVRGNHQAFEELLNNYSSHLYNFINKLVKNSDEAADIFQETLLRVWKYRKKFSLEKDFSNWLLGIAHNCCRNYYRPKIFQLFSFSSLLSEDDCEDLSFTLQIVADGQAKNPEKELLEKEHQETIASLIKQLPLPYRTVIVLRYREEKSYEEIAEITGYPLGTVKTYLFRAHKILQKKLKQNHGIPGI